MAAPFQLRDDIVFPCDEVFAMVQRQFAPEGAAIAENGTIVAVVEKDIELDNEVLVEDINSEEQFHIPVEYLKVCGRSLFVCLRVNL